MNEQLKCHSTLLFLTMLPQTPTLTQRLFFVINFISSSLVSSARPTATGLSFPSSPFFSFIRLFLHYKHTEMSVSRWALSVTPCLTQSYHTSLSIFIRLAYYALTLFTYTFFLHVLIAASRLSFSLTSGFRLGIERLRVEFKLPWIFYAFLFVVDWFVIGRKVGSLWSSRFIDCFGKSIESGKLWI